MAFDPFPEWQFDLGKADRKFTAFYRNASQQGGQTQRRVSRTRNNSRRRARGSSACVSHVRVRDGNRESARRGEMRDLPSNDENDGFVIGIGIGSERASIYPRDTAPRARADDSSIRGCEWCTSYDRSHVLSVAVHRSSWTDSSGEPSRNPSKSLTRQLWLSGTIARPCDC